jgi:hypothetical protein
VTNDKFRDYIRKIEANPSTNEPESIKRERQWLKQHCVSFTFKSDEFLANPDSSLFQKFPYETYKQFNDVEDE